jgi:hypothetical protein
MESLDIVLSIATGLGLAAAAGFRVFVPLLAAGLAFHFGVVEPSSGFDWLAQPVVLVALGVATSLEVAAYYVPGIDHALDVAAAPLALAAGVLVAASVMADVPPWLRWAAAIIAGGGATATTYSLSSLTRAKSAAATAGLGNPVVSTAELAGSAVLAVLALLAPFVALLALLWLGYRLLRRRRSAPA